MKDNWHAVAISEICESYAGGTPNRSNPKYYNGEIPWISSGEVNQAYISDTKEKITEEGLRFSSAKWIPNEAILLAMYGATAGQVSKLKIRATSNQAVLALMPYNADDYFIYYVLNFIKNRILYLAQGSGQPNLSKSLIDKTIINLPPLPQQKKIAKILSTVDKVIEKTESAIAKYQAIKQGLMHDLFTRGIDVNTGKLRPTPQEAPDLYKESALGSIPRDWEVEVLDNCINPSTVITYGIVQTGAHVEGGVRVLRTVNLNKDGIDSSNLLRTTKAISDGYKRTYLKENDIVCNVRASVGDFNIIDKKLTDCNLTRGVARISLNDSINPIYMLAFLRSKLNADQMSLLIKGTTFIDINIADLRTLKVLLPVRIEEQNLIANSITSIESKIQSEQQALAKYQQIKAGLLQDLLMGKVEVGVD